LTMIRQPNDNGYSYIGTIVMPLLAQERTPENVRTLTQALHKIFDYYIRFYMLQGGIHDQNPLYQDTYQEMYLNCIELLHSVRLDETTTFNRIKRYYNKSVQGWIHNKIWLKKKRQLDIVIDEPTVNKHIDNKNRYLDIEYKTDLGTVDVHIDRELPYYFELLSTMFGTVVYKKKHFYEKRYREAVFYGYLRNGRLVRAVDFFNLKYGAVFHGN